MPSRKRRLRSPVLRVWPLFCRLLLAEQIWILHGADQNKQYIITLSPSSPSLSVRPSVRPSNDPKSRMHYMHGITFAISPHSCHVLFLLLSCLSCLSTLPLLARAPQRPFPSSPPPDGRVMSCPRWVPHPCKSIIKNPTARPHPNLLSSAARGPAARPLFAPDSAPTAPRTTHEFGRNMQRLGHEHTLAALTTSS